MIALKFARRKKAIFKIHYTTGHFFPKKFLSLVFYDNRDLKISKYKKSEQYFRYKIEIFIRLFDEHFARHFESHWRETWRHTGRRNVPQISLETPSPPPPSKNWTRKWKMYKICRHLRKSDAWNVRNIKLLKFNLDALVSQSCFELILWMNKLKTIDRKAFSWKFLIKTKVVKQSA